MNEWIKPRKIGSWQNFRGHSAWKGLKSQEPENNQHRMDALEPHMFVSPLPPRSPSLVTSTLPTMPDWAGWCSLLVSNCSWVSKCTHSCEITNPVLLLPWYQEDKMDNVSLVGGTQNFVLGDTVHYLCFLHPQMSWSICARIHPSIQDHHLLSGYCDNAGYLWSVWLSIITIFVL